MKLILKASADNTLDIELDDVVTPACRSLLLDDIHMGALLGCSETYQSVLNQQDNIDVLYSIGNQLFELLNTQADLMTRWLETIGPRRLEVLTVADPNRLQRLLLNLPWEVLAYNKQFLAADTQLYEVVRRVGIPNPQAQDAKYSDLTLAFMAADPNFNSGLNYEAEERAILQATRRAKNLNLWVDDSGNLDKLTQRITESGHCDMAHISCHGGYHKELGFTLQMEDDYYRPQTITPSAFQNLTQKVQCLFLSACHTAEVTDALPFAMQLAKLGVPNVIGWDGSVADENASVFSAEVYHSLIQQASVPIACANARQKLLEKHLKTGKYQHWHLGRVYLAPHGGWPLISSERKPSPKRRGKSSHDLLDRRKKVVPVASKETFVGRRKETKQALRAFDENSIAGVLLTGIGGSGKSSLAARIVHRMEREYKAAIIYKDYSEIAILSELKQFIPVNYRNEDYQRYLADIQQNPDFFADNLVEILEEHLSEHPVVIVVDDLEQHALESLADASHKDGRVNVKKIYRNALSGLIEAFERADTRSRLLFTSRHNFRLLDKSSQDLAQMLLEIEVPDMNEIEQEKHWLALLQSGVITTERNVARDRKFLHQIRSICSGNPGLQDVLYQPLLKGEYDVLGAALERLNSYHGSKGKANSDTNVTDVDKYLQRIALEAYHDALSDTERQCLRVLNMFEFAIPEELLLQAGPKLGIENMKLAMQRLDNFGLLTHWQSEGLEEHISCYGLAQKIVMPLTTKEKYYIVKVCAPLLWHIWFADFLQKYSVPQTETFHESIQHLLNEHFPSKYKGELPLQSLIDQERIALLHHLCITTTLANSEHLDFSASEFLDLFELSLSLHTFEKLRVSAASVDGLSSFQWSTLFEVFDNERIKFHEFVIDYPQDIVRLLIQRFGARPQLLVKGYQIYFGKLDAAEIKTIESIPIHNKEDRHLAEIKLAKTKEQKAQAYGQYANFLFGQKQDYHQAEVMYQYAIDIDPNNAHALGGFALFLEHQKQDYKQTETMYLRAIDADPNATNILSSFALFLENQKQDYSQAETMFQRAIDADPNNAHALVSFALFLKNQKQDYEQAEIMYHRAIDTNPNNAICLGNFAVFLSNQKQDYEQAEIMYQRAIDVAPDNADILNSFAVFLNNQKQDYEQAETMFQRAIVADPDNANILNSFAVFLKNQKQDYEQAETMFQRAIVADPKNANALSNFAIFLEGPKRDYKQAKIMYQRAIEAEPDHANSLGNFARLLFVSGRNIPAQEHLENAESQPNLPVDLELELAFYRYAHCPPHDLSLIKQQLLAGARSIDWDLSANVSRAIDDQHPHPELLDAMANTISGKQELETLNQYSEWIETK